ncbi:hypothetical protein LXL04_011636 [Taraxacum kok-saghyz]
MDLANGMDDKEATRLLNLAALPEGSDDWSGVVKLGYARGEENVTTVLLQLCINSRRFCNIVLQVGSVPSLVALSQFDTPKANNR